MTATYATLSDSASGGVTATAATVVLGGEDDAGFDLAYTKLKPGEPQRGTLTVRYEGSVPADVSLEFAGYSALCPDDGKPLADVDPLRVAIEVEDGPVSDVGYCSLLNDPLPLGTFAAGDERDISIDIALNAPTPGDYRSRSSTDDLVVSASHGFTDRIEGSISIDIANFGSDLPPIPDECAGMSFAEDQVIELGNQKDVWHAADHGTGPFLVFAGNGKDVVTGSDAADCLVGGTGKDTFDGGPGDDVVIGGPRAGSQPTNTGDKDELIGGPGADTCVGDADKDTFDQSCESGAPPQASGAREKPDGQQVQQQRSAETTESAPAPTTNPQEPSQPPESAGQPTSETESGSPSTPKAAPSPTQSETPKADEEDPARPTSTSESSPTK